jgi:hypothetical protein
MQKGQPVRTVAASGLAALLMSGNSGGIVGLILGLGVRPGRGCAPFRLGFATLEVLPQRRAQAPLLACLLPALVRAFGPIVHGGKDTNRRGAKEGPLCGGCRGRSVLAPLWTLWQGSPHSRPHFFYSHPARRCRSSVVEHSLGKGEVVSSILTGSTRKSPSRALHTGQLRQARMLMVQLGLTPTAKKTTPGHCG